MIQIDPIVRGQEKNYRVSFFDKDSESPIDTTGWVLHIGFGRDRGNIGSFVRIEATPTAPDAAQGIITATLSVDQVSAINNTNCIIDFSVQTNSARVPLLLASARVMDGDSFVQQHFSQDYANNDLMQQTPTVVSGNPEAQSIQLNFSTQIDPVFDLGVFVKFDELSPATKEYLDQLQADVTAKHAHVMGG